jgi:hypothetical protein
MPTCLILVYSKVGFLRNNDRYLRLGVLMYVYPTISVRYRGKLRSNALKSRLFRYFCKDIVPANLRIYVIGFHIPYSIPSQVLYLAPLGIGPWTNR